MRMKFIGVAAILAAILLTGVAANPRYVEDLLVGTLWIPDDGAGVAIDIGTNAYSISESNNALFDFKNTVAAASNIFMMRTNDSDGTDSAAIMFMAEGTSIFDANSSYLGIGYDATQSAFIQTSWAYGTGTPYPIILYSNANTGQLVLNTDGTIDIGSHVDIADDKDLRLGTDNDIRLRYDEATDNRAEWHDGTNLLAYLTDAGTTGTWSVTGNTIVQDDKATIFGTDSDIQFSYDEITDNRLEITDGTNLLGYLTDAGTTGNWGVTGDTYVRDDKKIIFGTDSDIQEFYDETTDNRLEWSDGTNLLMSLTDNGTEGDLQITGDFIANTITTLAGEVQSGEGTPTVGTTSNVASTASPIYTWVQVGGFIQVQYHVSVTPSSAALTTLEISIPIASNFAATTDAIGNGSWFESGAAMGAVYAECVAANDTAILKFYANSTNAHIVHATVYYDKI